MGKKWQIPVTWQMSGVVCVEADTLDEAIDLANNDGEIGLPSGNYVDSSFEVSFDDVDYIRQFYNGNQSDANEFHTLTDYSKFSTEDLVKMEAAAYAEYYKLATNPRTNPSKKDLEPLEKATAKWEAISEELYSRKQSLNDQIQSASARSNSSSVAPSVKEKEPVSER